MALTRSFDSSSVPIAAATPCTFLALVPVAHISLTAATAALFTLWQRSITLSGKKLPVRGFGILRAT